MTWLDLLTTCQEPPAWSGPARIHNLLSAGDEPEDQPVPLAPQQDERFCTGPCEKTYPATTEFFYSHRVKTRRYFYNKCKECMKAEERERAARRLKGAA